MYSHLSYIRRSNHMRRQAKAHLGYIGNRPGRDGEELERTLFGKGFGAYTPEQVRQLIDQAPDNTLFWRLILNPDPVLENAGKSLDLRALTADAVKWLEKRLGTEELPRDIPFVAAIHDDHSPKAHVHGILFMSRQGREKPITPEILNEFRAAVSAMAIQQQRERQTAIASRFLDLSASHVIEQEVADPSGGAAAAATVVENHAEQSGAGGGDAAVSFDFDAGASPSCPACGVGTLIQRPNSRVFACDTCGYAQRLGVVIRQGRGKEAAHARSL